MSTETTEDTQKDITQLLEEALTDAQLADLTSLISLTHDDLCLGDTYSMFLIEDQHAEWIVSVASMFEMNEETEIINFVNDIDNGFTLSKEGIREKDYEKLEQARTMFDQLKRQLPPVIPTVDLMLRDIQKDFIKNLDKTTVEEAESILGFKLVTPTYLPERFEIYGVFSSTDYGIAKQIWYDPNALEFLEITTSKLDTQDCEGTYVFTDHLLTPAGTFNHRYCWANYLCTYDFVENGISVYGYMLVNDSNNQAEYREILYSLKE